MTLAGTDVELVKAAALKPAQSPDAARQRQPTTTSFRMELRACRRDRLLSPDPAEETEEQEDRGQTDEGAANLARVCVYEHVTGHGNAEGDATHLSVQSDRPGIGGRVGVTLRAVGETVRRRDDADD